MERQYAILHLTSLTTIKPCEVSQDRAVGSIVTMALRGQVLKRSPHLVKFASLAAEFVRPREREGLHVHARPPAIVPQRYQLADLLDRKPEIARAPDEAQGMHVALVVVAVTRIPPRGRLGRQPADDPPLREDRPDPGGRGFADLHSRALRSRSELPITATELKDIAAPAMIGLSRRPNHG